MVAHQLGLFLESHHLLNDRQGAYHYGRSVEHILLYAVDTITQALDNGDSVCAAFLDLRKAFDSLDHCLLLQRLFDLGISGVELTWFSDYLTHRLQRVKCGLVELSFLIGVLFLVVFRKAVHLDHCCFLFM